jgi:hypothetical protein
LNPVEDNPATQRYGLFATPLGATGTRLEEEPTFGTSAHGLE